ncbi:MAG: putative transposase [Planctomycetes bacterium ADurb.Bin412]|nr:MAG: putative transposase [Planctomycetes bacterium ADurb.Bin412]
MSTPAVVYRPRNPQDSDYYRCVEDNFETFVQIYDEHFSRQYGFWRPYIEQVIYRYLDCGDLHNGFARVKCKDCGHEYLLAFSCKRRHFCPSCHQKRVVEFGEWLCMDVLKNIPHRHFVFSIPKILRRYFLYDRKLLADLSRCAWGSLKAFLQDAVHENDPIPGAVIAMQTFGDFLGFNPHTHILVTDGCFYGDGGMFRVAPPLELKKLEAIFRHKVFRLLLNKGKITQELIAMLSSWRYSGFNVFCGNRISPTDDTAMENLARYIIRASFSQERMQYLDQEGTVVYRSKDGAATRNFPALEWLAAMCSHIPNRGEQMVRYYGYYSNVSRGKRQKEGLDNAIPCIFEPQGTERAFRKSWARLIQKIYEVDPLVCPKCQGTMRIISFIEAPSVIRDILNHLGLWLLRARPPPKIHDPPVCILGIGRSAAPSIADDVSQIPVHDDHFYVDPQYSWDEYIQA